MTLPLTRLDEGLWRLRLPMRFSPGHINSYLLEDDGGWLVIDCGNNSEDTRRTWQAFLDSPKAGAGIRRILLTHAHPDHAGSAGWLMQQTGAPLLLAGAEEDAYQRLWRGSSEQRDAVCDFFAGWGASEAQQQSIFAFMQGFSLGCPPLDGDVFQLAPGETLSVAGREWRLHGGYGHTPCNLLLEDVARGWLITGDQVLPSIQPNVSLWWGSDPDPLGSCLDSLAALSSLEVRHACPAHGEVFDDFADRCRQIRRQHLRRLDRLRTALAEGNSDVMSLCQAVLGKAIEGPLFMLVAGQLFAMLAYLERRGEVAREAGAGVHFRPL